MNLIPSLTYNFFVGKYIYYSYIVYNFRHIYGFGLIIFLTVFESTIGLHTNNFLDKKLQSKM